MEINAEQQKQLKNTELELFKAFISVCQKLNLTYYVVGGTLLGAVRHKGFIPWDDDIDVAMMRDDYEVFLEKAPALLPEYTFLQSIYSEPEYLLNFAKLRHNGTTFLETSVKSRKINHGVFIDIFPLDYYPDSNFSRKAFHFKNILYRYRIGSEFEGIPFKWYHKLAHIGLKIIFPSVKKTLRKRDQLLKRCKHGQLIASHCGAWGKKEIVPADWYQSTVLLEFEGLQVAAPCEYHTWLTHYYGDYMLLPPVEKQKSHHFTEVIDTDTPFTNFI